MSYRGLSFGFRRVIVSTRLFLQDRFNLHEDRASNRETIEYIEKSVLFRGPSLWILMFAILICSIGLNVNNTAVIIGAMLISPLMGPIMGVGLGVGTNNFELILKALKNLGVAAGISILTSMCYFLITPLQEAQSELLARTTPTLWDVLIALFGGLAGIVAGSRKEKSNAIPGVAIATALMPPLCTAGYGLATGQLTYFLGAFYLFFINSVFISLATFLIVRALRFPKKEFVSPNRETQVKRYIAVFVLLTLVPSVFTAYDVVIQSIFQRKANAFINREFQMEGVRVIGKDLNYDPNGSTIEVTLYGAQLDQEHIAQIRKRLDLPEYRLHQVSLVIHQGNFEDASLDLARAQEFSQETFAIAIENLYKNNQQALNNKDEQIKLLEDEIVRLRSRELPVADLAREINAINDNIEEFTVTPTVVSRLQNDTLRTDTLYLAFVQFSRRPKTEEVSKLEAWLKARVKADNLRLIAQ